MKAQPFRVAILDDYEGLASSVPSFEALRARADVEVMRERLASNETLGRALKEVNAVLLMRERTRFGEQQLSLLPALQLIAQTGHSIAHLDLPAATRRGIAVAVTPNDSGVSTVELTFGLILAVLRQIPQVDRRMREEAWPAVAGRLLQGKTLGVIGLGRIGAQVALIAKAFNTRVLATSRTLTEEKARAVGAERVSLETLLRESDIVTIHVPLRPETRGLIGEKEIGLMKPGAFLINTARGPIVSEAALLRALEEKRLGGAGLDVFDVEPLPLDHPFRRLDNIVLLSHRGYATVEILRQRYELAMNNIINFMDGSPTNLLNPEVLAPQRK
ncbi:MAG: D-2-hydroxyacid dehydrogenase family protein [Deltaproteobacteria bacterium]|nr:D-2-hydroxyacid dehydrogenase family protein [Deltaproteobacteria bacterium]